MRTYVDDLVGCLDSKMPIILALEGRMLSLLCQQTEGLLHRRHQDIKDQSEEMSLAIKNMSLPPNDTRNRRAAEREGRRVRRRKVRESQKGTMPHYEGMSTDDEEPDACLVALSKEKESILDDTRHVFDDVVEDFSSVTALKLKFERWKIEEPDSYERAYVNLCLVKLLAPYVRLQLVSWNPLEGVLEGSAWYEALLFYGEPVAKDPDLCLIPRIMERVLVPKLSAFAEKVWDPMSGKQTLNLVRVAKKLLEDYPNVGGQSPHVQKFLSKVAARIQKAIDEDVFIPLYPKEVLDNRSGAPSAFFHRQFWSCMKLMKNIMSWYGVLAEDPLKELTLCSLLNRYLIMALNNCIGHRDTVEKCKMVVSILPTSWIRGGLPQLDFFIRFLKLYEQHLKKLCSSGQPSELNSHVKDSLQEVTTILGSFTVTRSSDK
uniref:Putative transcriptional regulator binding to the gc-rich sequence n=1 Tax=Ornithodoros turicata TaxID=34597 RepID=A0A2R5LD21_9ACAR